MGALGISVLLLLLTIVAAINGASVKEKPYYDVTDKESCLNLFEEFMSKYNKQYNSEEEKLQRFANFIENIKIINEYNSKSETSVYDINFFSDLTEEEFVSGYTGYVHRPDYVDPKIIDTVDISVSDVPDAFDWREKGVITRVKKQESCGSCWAFSAIGNVESQYAIKHNKIVELSEQQLVSCATNNFGCKGGYPSLALKYLKEVGVETEVDYPYISGKTRQNETCKFDKNKVKAVILDYEVYNFTKLKEEELKALVYKNGPLSILIYASPLIFYSGGILQDCNGEYIDHAVLLVGYGEEKGVPFWIVKNSWGEEWGEKGYFRMKRGVNCLLLMDTTGTSCSVQ